MLETIQALADAMVAKDSKLRIAFNEANDTKAHEPEAQHFLKAHETRLGRDFKLYAFMAKVEGEEDLTVMLLEELVLPLETLAPEAYKAGLSYLREQGSVFGDKQSAWEDMIDSFQPAGP